MPEFRCLGKTFQVSNADLGRAPDSVLSASWRIKGSQGVVDLTAWPEPDLEVFQVLLWLKSVDICCPHCARLLLSQYVLLCCRPCSRACSRGQTSHATVSPQLCGQSTILPYQ